MSEEHVRRRDDEGIWKVVKLYPMVVGIVMAAVSMGGYLATVKYMSEEIGEVHHKQSALEDANLDTTKIISRVVALQESMDKRLTRLEGDHDGWNRRR